VGEREKERAGLTSEVRAFIDGLAELIAEAIQDEGNGQMDSENEEIGTVK